MTLVVGAADSKARGLFGVQPVVVNRSTSAAEQTNSPSPSRGLTFSDPPADGEFLPVSLFPVPLIPVRLTTPQENRELARAIQAYDSVYRRDGERDNVTALLDFLDARLWLRMASFPAPCSSVPSIVPPGT